MGSGQLAIKIILIVVFLVIAAVLVLPGRSARRTAIRSLLMIALVIVAGLAIIFPSIVNDLAHLVGVGRGTDLLLYGLIVVFVANAILAQRRHRTVERQITLLSRTIAIASAESPDGEEHNSDPAVR